MVGILKGPDNQGRGLNMGVGGKELTSEGTRKSARLTEFSHTKKGEKEERKSVRELGR